MTGAPEGNAARRAALLPPAVLLVAATLVYVLTTARHVLGPDNPEFSTLFRVGGVAHPSGYPLYVLYLRAMRWLPAVSPAHGASIATALMAGFALYVAYGACRARGASAAASAVVLSAHAFSARAWILATHAEVFSMNAAIAAAIVWAAIDERLRAERRVAVLCLLAGLGLANHHSIVLLAPIGIYGVVVGLRESERRARAVALGLGALAAGLLPYAYLLWVGRHPAGHFVWGDVTGPSGLLFHFRRGEYGTASFAVHSSRADRPGQVLLLALNTLRGLVGLPLLALLGARRERSVPAVCIAASLVLAGPAFVTLFNLSTTGLDRIVVERFHLLPQLLVCLLIAPAVDRVLARVRAPWWPALPLALVSVLLTYPELREHNRPSVELFARNTLAIAPPSAVILGTGDHRFGGFLYAREALGLRRDVHYVDVWLLINPWYRRRMSEALGVALVEPRNRSLSTVALAEQLLATGRPLYFTDAFTAAIGSAFATYPVGTLRRVLPRGERQPPPDAVEAMNVEAFRAMTFEPTNPVVGTWGGDLQRAYAEPWAMLAGVWTQLGNAERAAACRRRAELLEPDPH